MTVKNEKKDKLLPYVTNLDEEPTQVHEYYKSRFRIETQYRLKNKFMGKNCSKVYRIRYTFFVLAISPYNVWILLNIAKRKEGLEPGKILMKVDNMKHICRKIVYRKSPTDSKLVQSIEWF